MIALTEILLKERYTRDVDEEGDHFRDNHVDVPANAPSGLRTDEDAIFGNLPCRDFQCNHDEFVQNKSRKRNRDDIQKLVLEQNQGHDHDSSACGTRQFKRSGVQEATNLDRH